MDLALNFVSIIAVGLVFWVSTQPALSLGRGRTLAGGTCQDTENPGNGLLLAPGSGGCRIR
jgi:hypothetical protein